MNGGRLFGIDLAISRVIVHNLLHIASGLIKRNIFKDECLSILGICGIGEPFSHVSDTAVVCRRDLLIALKSLIEPMQIICTAADIEFRIVKILEILF